MTVHNQTGTGGRAFQLRLPGRIRGERGMALMTVLVFSLVFIVGMLAFFTVAAYEANQAELRENSTRAFFLADGAIERAKAELIHNGLWRDGYAWTPSDGGKYKLSVSDTTWNGQPAVHFYSEGVYGRNKRDVEVYAKILPTTPYLAIWAGGNIDTRGGVDLIGHAHANGTMDGGHFSGGTYDCCYNTYPPPVYTDPDSFQNATYYYVTAQRNPVKELYINDRNGARLFTIPAGAPIDAGGEMNWDIDNARKMSISYRPNGGGPHATDFNVGKFAHQGADIAVVINFGQGATNKHDTTYMMIQATGGADGVITPVIINARYTGGNTPNEHLNPANWEGDELDLKTQTLFEPDYCIDLVVKRIDKFNAGVQLGSPTRAALTYVVGDADWSAGHAAVYGSLVVLGNASFGGNTHLTFDPAFISCLPPHLGTNWPAGTSGSMNIFEWREPAPKAIS